MMELIVLNILNFKTFKVEWKSTALAIFAVIQIFKGADLKFYSTKKKKKKKKKSLSIKLRLSKLFCHLSLFQN